MADKQNPGRSTSNTSNRVRETRSRSQGKVYSWENSSDFAKKNLNGFKQVVEAKLKTLKNQQKLNTRKSTYFENLVYIESLKGVDLGDFEGNIFVTEVAARYKEAVRRVETDGKVEVKLDQDAMKVAFCNIRRYGKFILVYMKKS